MDVSGPDGVSRITTGSLNQPKAASASVSANGRRMSRLVSILRRIDGPSPTNSSTRLDLHQTCESRIPLMRGLSESWTTYLTLPHICVRGPPSWVREFFRPIRRFTALTTQLRHSPRNSSVSRFLHKHSP